MRQVWHDLLFAHWPVGSSDLRSIVPEPLEIDNFKGQNWIGVVPFRMSGVRPRGLPPLPWLSAFPELNVRCYVTYKGKPGVYFFSLDASNALAVQIARRWFQLPYFHARMSLILRGNEIEYSSDRFGGRGSGAALRARYKPIGPVFQAAQGTLEYWLTERYCLYTVPENTACYRTEIHHSPWPLQIAECEIFTNTMAKSYGIQLPALPPLLHFTQRQDVIVWHPVPAQIGGCSCSNLAALAVRTGCLFAGDVRRGFHVTLRRLSRNSLDYPLSVSVRIFVLRPR